MCSAPDDFSTGDAKRVRNLLKDIADVRSNKIKQGLEQIPTAAIIKLNNISQTELNEIRGTVFTAFGRLSTAKGPRRSQSRH